MFETIFVKHEMLVNHKHLRRVETEAAARSHRSKLGGSPDALSNDTTKTHQIQYIALIRHGPKSVGSNKFWVSTCFTTLAVVERCVGVSIMIYNVNCKHLLCKSAHTALAVKACLLGCNSATLNAQVTFVYIAVAISALAGGGGPLKISHRNPSSAGVFVIFRTIFGRWI